MSEVNARLDKCETRLDDHDKEFTAIKVSSGKTEAKIDITNKILGAIALMVGGGIVTFFVALFQGLIK